MDTGVILDVSWRKLIQYFRRMKVLNKCYGKEVV